MIGKLIVLALMTLAAAVNAWIYRPWEREAK